MNRILEDCPAPEKCREHCDRVEYEGSKPKCGNPRPCIHKPQKEYGMKAYQV